MKKAVFAGALLLGNAIVLFAALIVWMLSGWFIQTVASGDAERNLTILSLLLIVLSVFMLNRKVYRSLYRKLFDSATYLLISIIPYAGFLYWLNHWINTFPWL
ncbi:MAG: hypothetical protein QM689_08170 [Oscillospiraceae bacterium]